VTAAYRPGTDWQVTAVAKVTDGDTVRLFRRKVYEQGPYPSSDGMRARQIVYFEDDPEQSPNGVAIRLITLDTPERGQPGYAEAREDVARWLLAHEGRLRVETWPGGGFDRLLGDVYVEGDRSNTLSQFMLRDANHGLGWDPYVAGGAS
jgi:endonuclease YncB( thermonuclease family)